MNPRAQLRSFRIRLSGLILLALCGSGVLAQADPPGRVGRLNHSEGTVTFSPAGDNEWTDAALNRPLTRGDRLWTDRKSRAELQIGSSAVRMDGQTHLEISALDDQAAQLSLTQGTVYVRVRSLPDGENFEIDTPNLAYRAVVPGDYRIDVDPADGTTRVTIHSGTGAVYGEGGHAVPMGGGQQITFRTRSLAQVATQESPPQDAFDRWAAERNRREDQSISARYVPREVVGYQQLDAHGQWKQETTHGTVWFPHGTPANWAPYRHGHWEWIAPWGWNWIDDAPWGFAPFHYGRWALIESRWAWVPGRLGLRPVYAPALVAFTGGSGMLSRVANRSGVTWFPLAPGEMWQPAFRASLAYISNVNRHMVPGTIDATYAYQRRPEAVTAISRDDFHRGRPVGASWLRVAAATLTDAGIVPPPPMPERTVLAARDKPPVRPAPPSVASEVRQVTAGANGGAPGDARRDRDPAQRSPSVAGPVAPHTQQAASAAAAGRRMAAQRAEEAKAMQQAKLAAQTAEQARDAERSKAAQQARASEQAKVTEQARVAQQAKAAQEAKAAEQARRAELARQNRQAALEQAKTAQQARLAEAAKLEHAQRKPAEPARPSRRALGTEMARAEALAQQAKVARRAPRAEIAVREAASRPGAGAREQQAKRAVSGKRATAAARAEPARQQQLAQREQQAKRAELAKREVQARRDERLQAQARRDERQRREAHAQRVEQARRSAERDAQALGEQRAQRELQARREAEAREQAQREQAQRAAWQRQQQATAEQWKRDQQAWEQQQRERARARPDLRDPGNRPPEVWQRGVPILTPGRTS